MFRLLRMLILVSLAALPGCGWVGSWTGRLLREEPLDERLFESPPDGRASFREHGGVI